jgi:hypothetical protein
MVLLLIGFKGHPIVNGQMQILVNKNDMSPRINLLNYRKIKGN